MTLKELKSSTLRNKTAYGVIHRTLGWFVQYKDANGRFGEMPVSVWNDLS